MEREEKRKRIMDVLCCPFVVYKKVCWEVAVVWNSGRGQDQGGVCVCDNQRRAKWKEKIMEP
jgi:uncharacterized protein YbaR (Trm112 family)